MARILSIVSILAACGGTSGGGLSDAGANSCTAGLACTPATANACQVFETACTGSVVSCVAASNVTDGTGCGTGQFCNTGACVTGTTRTVSSTLQTRYVFDDGHTELRPGWALGFTITGGETFNTTVSALLVADDSDPSGYKTFPVTVAADGTFSVPGVPFGPYFIQVDVPAEKFERNNVQIIATDRMLYEVTTSTPDLTFFTSVRPDVRSAPFDTSLPVQVHFKDMLPYATGDAFHVRSSQVGLTALYSASAFTPKPAVGSTSLDAGMDWNRQSFLLPEPAKGDSEWFEQRRTQTLDGGTVIQSTVAFAKVTNFEIADAGTSTLDVDFAPAPQTGTLAADFRFSRFNALGDSVHPGAVGSQLQPPFLTVGMVAHGFDFPNQPGDALAGPPMLLFPFNDNFGFLQTQEVNAQTFLLQAPESSINDVNYGNLAYPRVYDSLWKEAMQFVYLYDVSLAVQGFNSGIVFGAGFYRSFLPREQMPNPIVPLLGPPTAPRLNGADAFASLDPIGARQAVISWSPPALGKATKYLVTVGTTSNTLKDRDVSSVTAVLYDQTSFKVPNGFIDNQNSYYGVITAVKSPDQLNDPIAGIGSPSVEVTTVFGFFERTAPQ